MGIIWAVIVIITWAAHLVWILLFRDVQWEHPVTCVHILIQAYLYTGLFITAHDSMHGSVAENRLVNRAAGKIALWLFAAFSYQRMFTKHMEHHKVPATDEDPDFSEKSQHVFRWFFRFFFRYATVRQLVTMALLFNIGLYLLDIPLANLLVFWVLPAFLGTFQLFYFGTYLPHRYPHTPDMEPHKARSQRKNHVAAMASCYFFGYHYEHHAHPRVPWWRLYQYKESNSRR
ncbi:MAG: fatty acid desaturase [Spirochaetota bacterium]